MGDANPRQDEETRIDGDLVEIGDPFFSFPSEASIPRAYAAGSRAEADAGNRPVVAEGDVFEAFAYGSGKAEAMAFLYKPFIETFKRSAPDHKERQRRKSCKRNIARGVVDLDFLRRFSGSPKPCRNHSRWGKSDATLCMELEEEAPADHIPGRSICLGPVPETAEFLRKKEPALTRITGNKFPYVFYILFGENPAPASDALIHRLLSIAGCE
jgi:hypothetical protein